MNMTDFISDIKQPLYHNELDLERFSLMLDNNSQCYKFYWLEALADLLVRDGKKEITYFEAASEMIASAWYTISEYHLHMGSMFGSESKNAIERAVNLLQQLSGLKSNAERDKVLEAINNNRSDLEPIIKQMTDDVPYRLLSPFVPELKGSKLWSKDKKLIEYFNTINQNDYLPYALKYASKLETGVLWGDPWAEMVKENYLLIREWIRAKKVKYLQDRNPSVPGIIYKLDPEGKRDLGRVRDIWNAIMKKEDVYDIYSDEKLNDKRYDIDHFIPWSYVTTDELWNLTPSKKAVNIAKSNHLPEWELYMGRFTDIQLQLNRNIHSDTHIHALFENCRNKNLSTLWASEQLYRPCPDEEFCQLLSENMKTIYTSAKLQGYTVWNYSKEGGYLL